MESPRSTTLVATRFPETWLKLQKGLNGHSVDLLDLSRDVSENEEGLAYKMAFRLALSQGYSKLVCIFSKDVSPSLLEKLLEAKTSEAQPVHVFHEGSEKGKLSFLERRLIGRKASFFESENRVFSTAALRKIPYELNSDDSLFSVEILLQFLAMSAQVVETGRPGGEQRIALLKKVVAYAKYRFQKIGFFCSLQYRGLIQHTDRYSDKSTLGASTHSAVLRGVAPKPGKVLDLGCGPGHVAKVLKKVGCHVTGADIQPNENFPGDRYIQCDLNATKLAFRYDDFDYVLLLDVLEHLDDPESFLIKIRRELPDSGPAFFMSTGNVAFFGIRAMLALGIFNYGERGILDVTHKRLFTLNSFKQLLRETGYEIQEVRGIGIPFQLVIKGFVGKIMAMVSQGMASLWPSLFSYQMIVKAVADPKRSYRLPSSAVVSGR